MVAWLKSNKKVWILAAFAVIVAAGAAVWALKPVAAPAHGAIACWADNFYSPEEMVEKADLILTGKVARSDASMRADLVVTTHEIQVDRLIKGEWAKGEGVPVLQTGGTMDDGYSTLAFMDAPLFEKGEKLLLFLKATDEGHYLVMGGYQGVGRVSVLGRVNMQDPEDKAGHVFQGLTVARAERLVTETLTAEAFE